MNDLLKSAHTAGLTPVQRQVTRNGKTFMQTVYVNNNKQTVPAPAGNTAFDFSAFDSLSKPDALRYLKENGITWNESDKPGVNWMRAVMAAKKAANISHQPIPKQNDTKNAQSVKDGLVVTDYSATPSGAPILPSLVAQAGGNKAAALEAAKAAGLKWKENAHAGINWMRAVTADNTAAGVVKQPKEPKVQKDPSKPAFDMSKLPEVDILVEVENQETGVITTQLISAKYDKPDDFSPDAEVYRDIMTSIGIEYNKTDNEFIVPELYYGQSHKVIKITRIDPTQVTSSDNRKKRIERAIALTPADMREAVAETRIAAEDGKAAQFLKDNLLKAMENAGETQRARDARAAQSQPSFNGKTYFQHLSTMEVKNMYPTTLRTNDITMGTIRDFESEFIEMPGDRVYDYTKGGIERAERTLRFLQRLEKAATEEAMRNGTNTHPSQYKFYTDSQNDKYNADVDLPYDDTGQTFFRDYLEKTEQLGGFGTRPEEMEKIYNDLCELGGGSPLKNLSHLVFSQSYYGLGRHNTGGGYFDMVQEPNWDYVRQGMDKAEGVYRQIQITQEDLAAEQSKIKDIEAITGKNISVFVQDLEEMDSSERRKLLSQYQQGDTAYPYVFDAMDGSGERYAVTPSVYLDEYSEEQGAYNNMYKYKGVRIQKIPADGNIGHRSYGSAGKVSVQKQSIIADRLEWLQKVADKKAELANGILSFMGADVDWTDTPGYEHELKHLSSSTNSSTFRMAQGLTWYAAKVQGVINHADRVERNTTKANPLSLPDDGIQGVDKISPRTKAALEYVEANDVDSLARLDESDPADYSQGYCRDFMETISMIMNEKFGAKSKQSKREAIKEYYSKRFNQHLSNADIDTILSKASNIGSSLRSVSDETYIEIEKRMKDDWDKDMHHGKHLKIYGIYEIIDLKVDDAFQTHVENSDTEQQTFDNDPNPVTDYSGGRRFRRQSGVKQFYHGCSTVACYKILGHSGQFKVITAAMASRVGVQTTGKMLGDGVYLASKSSKSAQYLGSTFTRSGGTRGAMFICDAEIGKTVEHTRGNKIEQYKGQADTMVALKSTGVVLNDEWAVADPTRVRPRYLIDASIENGDF